MEYKGTYFCDLDGTIFKHGTTEFLPNAQKFLECLEKTGYRIIFMTRRGDKEFLDHPVFGMRSTQKMLKAYKLDHHYIIYDVMSPRVMVDDSEVGIIKQQTDRGFSEDDIKEFDCE